MTQLRVDAIEASTSAIEFRDVSVAFQDARNQWMVALRNVSFQIPRGSFTSVIGPSGCGKTTLLRLLAGLEQPIAGSAVFHGKKVTSLNKDVGFITQDSNLYPWMNVRQNIEFALEMRSVSVEERRSLSDDFIRLIGLTGFEHHYPYQLSGGMQKRVSLARTMIYHPDIVLMDEPFGALDAQTRMTLQSDLQQMWREQSQRGQTTMLVTHDLTEAIALSDYIVVMSHRPGTVVGVFEVSLPRPRDVFDIQAAPGFAEIYDAIWLPLKAQVFATPTFVSLGELASPAQAAGGALTGAVSAPVVDPVSGEVGLATEEPGQDEAAAADTPLAVPAVVKALQLKPARSKRLASLTTIAWRLAIILAILGLWEGLSDNKLISQLIFSHPAAVAQRLYDLVLGQPVQGVNIYTQIQTTMTEWAWGFLIGSACAIAAGFILGRSRQLSRVLQPLILVFYGLPIVAIAPLFLVILGLGTGSKIAVSAIIAFFASFFQVYSGVVAIPEIQIQLARIMGASPMRVARRVIMPASLPFIFTGLRVGVPLAMTGAIIGEFVASSSGLGFFILRTTNTFDSSDLFATLIILMFIVYALGQILLFLERKALKWQPNPGPFVAGRGGV